MRFQQNHAWKLQTYDRLQKRNLAEADYREQLYFMQLGSMHALLAIVVKLSLKA